MLWYSKEWALDFADFIRDLAQDAPGPRVIEIHPPFSDYSDIGSFLDIYSTFENRITEYFPDVTILIENRSGTRYSGGDFVVSRINQLIELSNEIEQRGFALRVTLDIPQLFTAHQITKSRMKSMENLFTDIKDIRHNILGIHLWGKRDSGNGRRVAHVGDLNDYFMEDMSYKSRFLTSMLDVFDDDVCRYFVPEVNSGREDLVSIVNDLKEVGFKFV